MPEQATGAVDPAEHHSTKRRRALLLLIAALGSTVAGLFRRAHDELLARLLSVADPEGRVQTGDMLALKTLVRTLMIGAGKEAWQAVESKVPELIDLSIGMAGGAAEDWLTAEQSIRKSLAAGARGVAMDELYAAAVLSSMLGVAGVVQRAATRGETVRQIAPEIRELLVDRLPRKLHWIDYQQLNFAWTGAVRDVLGAEAVAYIWRLGPRKKHCKICLGRAGRKYDRDDPILNELGSVHINCGCWGEPVFA